MKTRTDCGQGVLDYLLAIILMVSGGLLILLVFVGALGIHS